MWIAPDVVLNLADHVFYFVLAWIFQFKKFPLLAQENAQYTILT